MMIERSVLEILTAVTATAWAPEPYPFSTLMLYMEKLLLVISSVLLASRLPASEEEMVCVIVTALSAYDDVSVV